MTLSTLTLLDAIGFLHTPAINTLLIKDYEESTNRKNKQKLLSAITMGISFNKYQKTGNIDVNLVMKTQQFLHDQLEKEKNPYLLADLIYSYAAAVKPEQSFTLVSKKLKLIQGKKFTVNGKQHDFITPMQADFLKIQIALMTSKSQKTYLKSMIIKSGSDKVFYPALYTTLYYYPVSTLPKELRKELKEDILIHKSLIDKFAKNDIPLKLEVPDMNKLIKKLGN